MDIVASVGYVGQSLFFIDEERFAHTTGKGIYIYDTLKGPREIVWRVDKDMLYCSVNLEAQLLFFSFKAADHPLELVRLTDISNPIAVENPYKSAIIHHELTRTGDRLYGISDVTDHHITVWKISGKSTSVLTSKNLTSPCHRLSVNPCDSDAICLYGTDGVYLATVHEIFGDYSLKIQKLYPSEIKKTDKVLSAPSIEDVGGSLNPQTLPSIQYVLWLPFHRLLIGLSNGELVEVNTDSKSSAAVAAPNATPTSQSSHKVLGKFLDLTLKATATGSTLIGTTALITSNFIVVGTTIGSVYWYNMGNYLNDVNASQSFIDNLKSPVRVSALGAGPITTLTIDPSFTLLIIGTSQGTIAKANVEPEPVDPDAAKNNNDAEANNDETTSKYVANNSYEIVAGEKLGNLVKTGLVFASKFLSMNVKKVTTRAKSSLSLLLLGGHDGVVTIWRQNEQSGDMITAPNTAAIRRSNPKSIEDMLRIETKSKSPIVALEVIQYGYYFVLCIGFANGYLEFWHLFGCEFDEEEAKEIANSAGYGNTPGASELNRFIEDDEGTCIVKLEASYLMKNKIFNSSFHGFTTLTSESGANNLDVRLAMTSVQDSQLYVMHIIKNNKLELAKVLDLYEITRNTQTNSAAVHSLVWMDDALFSFQEGNNQIVRHKFDAENNKMVSDTNTPIKLSGFGAISRVTLSPLMNSCVVVNSQGVGFYVALSTDLKSKMSWEGYKARKLNEAKDLICITSYANHGLLFVTGSIDGSLTIWRIDADNHSEAIVVVVHSVSLYSSPIVNVNFSVTSGSLYTSALDGTSMILFLGKFTNSKLSNQSQRDIKGLSSPVSSRAPAPASSSSPVKTAQMIQLQHQVSFYHVDTLDRKMIYDTDMLLSEKLNNEKEKELKNTFKFKAMGITAAIQEINQRLLLLIEQNNAREEIEQLPLEEFVLDLPSKKQFEEKKAVEMKSLQHSYFQANKLYELVSSRVKSYTYDTIQTPSLRIRPFLSAPEIDVNYDRDGVSSYPILKVSTQKQSLLEKIKRLRRLEVKTMKRSEDGSIKRVKGTEYFRCAWAANVRGFPTDLSYIVDEGTNWPLISNLEAPDSVDEPANAAAGGDKAQAAAAGGKPGATGGKDGNTVGGGKDGAPGMSRDEDDDQSAIDDEEVEVDEHQLLNLFYSPLVTRSIIQKRNQILFLQEIITKEKERFNTTFKTLKNEKEETVQQIESRLTRIQEILTELQTPIDGNTEYQQLEQLKKLFDDEIVNSVFTIRDEEVTSRPYETEAMKLQKLKELEEKLKKQQNNEEELIRQRALQDMMYGTLEMKKNLLLNEDLLLQKPAWMNEITNPLEMNEQQLKEYDLYQQKVKQILEEQAHYKKTLEQEYKKLKLEIHDICKTFNEKLLQMISKKLINNKVILANEIYITRIALTMVKSEQYQNSLKNNDIKLINVRKERVELKGKIEHYNKQFDDMKNKLLLLQEDEKTMDKTFKRDLQNLCNNTFDIESLKVFTDLYRKRIYPKSHLASSLLDGDGYNDRSESMDISNSQSQTRTSGGHGNSTNNATGITSGSKRSKDGKLGSTRTNSSSRGGTSRRSGGGGGGGNRRLKASRGIDASKNSSSNNMGPMQAAAQALLKSAANANNPNAPANATNHLYDNDVIIAREKDPFYTSLIAMLKKKKKNEVLLPILEPLRLESDCPEGFVVDQFSWAKLQELRTTRIEKEIEKNLLMNECNIMKTKLLTIDNDELSYTNTINQLRNYREHYRKELKDMEINLDLLITILQGQDEMNGDAIVTDYSQGLLIPIIIINKYNTRIKELGLEKINILIKIKIFRRKMNLIHWEAIHNTLQLKHYENYYTDIQLFRVTRDLQKVILEGENAFNQKERCEKIQSRKEYLSKDYQTKQASILAKITALEKQLGEKENEISGLKSRIQELTTDVQLARSIKESKESKFATLGASNGGGEDYINKKMKKIMDRRHMVDIARAQAEEIDYLRQELDRMRQRTFPSFVKATKNRLNSMY